MERWCEGGRGKQMLLAGIMSLAAATNTLATDDHLLLCEGVLTPTQGEYIEFVNMTGAPVSLDDYYLSDDADYALLPEQFGAGPSPFIGSSDFIARFPAGASIAHNQVVVVAFNATQFMSTYGSLPDYEIFSTDPSVPDMIEAYAGSIGFAASLTNGGEHAVLFTWDGASDLVQDVDAVILGTPSSGNTLGNKSGVTVDGPDADAIASAYALDSGLMPLQFADPGAGVSTKRILVEAGQELTGSGNGITGDDETSENIFMTWDSLFTPPDPGICNIMGGEPTGACCDTNGFTCTDDVAESDCQDPGEIFTEDAACADVVCEPVGACCVGGACYDDTPQSSCDQSEGDFSVGMTCSMVACTPVNPIINEIRIDQELDDTDEYFELLGTVGTDLTGLTYVVIGDDADDITQSGTVEAVVALSGMIGATGYFTVAEDTFTLATADLVLSSALDELNFENSDNLTHLLVQGWTGSVGDDLDTDNDGTFDSTPWSGIVDCVSVVEDPDGGDQTYCVATAGPDGNFAPGHVFRCEDGGLWQVGQFFVGVNDSPGETNDPFCGSCCDGKSCEDAKSELSCINSGAIYQGDETTCAEINCAAGACCVACACMDSLDSGECVALGGVFQGVGSMCNSVSCPQSDVIITEIMFNPASDDSLPTRTEWIEITNKGLSVINLENWTIADEDGESDPIAAGVTLGGMATAVLIPADTTVDQFQAAWGGGIQVVQVPGWDNLGGLDDDPGPANELLSLRDAAGVAVDVVNFDDEDDWPDDTDLGGASIRLSCVAYECDLNDNGGDWDLSALGVNGGINNTQTKLFNGLDVGSPGVTPCPDDGLGGCCRPDESCLDTSEAYCTDSGFSFFGVGSRCLVITCPATGPEGACCAAGICTESVSQFNCETGGGTHFGAGSTCADLTDEDCPETRVIISEIVEGSLDNNDGFGPSNRPRFVELTNTGCADADMSAYSMAAFLDGQSVLTAPSIQLSGTLIQGASYVVSFSQAPPLPGGVDDVFFNVYGFLPDAYMGAGFFDGNDAVALFVGTTSTGDDVPIADMYGVIGENGGAWSNVDTTARRNSDVISGNGGAFDLGNWTLDASGSLQGADDGESTTLLQSLTNPGVHVFDDPLCNVLTQVPLADDRFDVNGFVKGCATDADCKFGESGPDPETVCRDGACYVARQRSLSVRVNPLNAGVNYTYRISLDTGVAGAAVLGFTAAPSDTIETGPGPNLFHLTRIEDVPHYRDWTTLSAGIVTISDCEISPGNAYVVQSIAEGLDVGDEGLYSDALVLPTPAFNGDVTGGGSPGGPPNGAQGNLTDVFAQVLGFQDVQNEPKDWLDTEPNTGAAQPNLTINLADAFAGVQAFQQNPYPGPAPTDCP